MVLFSERPTERGGTCRNPWIQAVQMVGTPDDKDAIVVLETVNLIEEVAPYSIRDERVEILEDKIAWGVGTSLLEDRSHGSFWPTPLLSCQCP